MKSLILTFSCAAHREAQNAIRSTWGKPFGYTGIAQADGSSHRICDHLFVLGIGNKNTKSDELYVGVPDNYESVPQKHRQAIEWAKNEGYDYVFCSDIDTYIIVPRLLATDYMEHDFVGCRCSNDAHPSGGGGYWLSRKCFDPLIASSAIGHSWSDLWAYTILQQAGIKLHHDDRYLSRGGNPIPEKVEWDRGIVSVHLGRSDKQWDPDVMRRCHQSYLEAA